MTHLSEEQLVMHYYGEEGDTLAIGRHLEECTACRETYASLARVLNLADGMPVPERGALYGAELWDRVAPRLPSRRWFDFTAAPVWRWSMAAAAAVVLCATAFVAGRVSAPPSQPQPMVRNTQAREQVLRVAVRDYLDRSQTVLTELSNASAAAPLDISDEQERARDLVGEGRLYRQTAAAIGDDVVIPVLDELERVLLDVSNGPTRLAPEQVEGLRGRLAAQGIVFKIRVVTAQVGVREEPPATGGARL